MRKLFTEVTPNIKIIIHFICNFDRIICLFCNFIKAFYLKQITGINNITIKSQILSIIKCMLFFINNFQNINKFIKNKFPNENKIILLINNRIVNLQNILVVLKS